MVKRIFALASVSALTGLVSAVAAAGCSSSEPTAKAPLEAGTPNQSPEAGGPRPSEPGEDAGTDVEDGPCMQQNPIDATKFPYTSAKRSPNACSEKELQELANYFGQKAQDTEDISIAEWKKTVGESCAKCVFSDSTGAEWSPILVKGDKLDNVNRGGCIEIASGKRSCGAAYQRVAECRLAACVDTCKTAEQFTECLQDIEGIFTGPCKQAYDTLQTECGKDELAKYEAACKGSAFTFEGPVRVQCITGHANAAKD